MGRLELLWLGTAAGAGVAAWLATTAIRPWLARRATVHPNVRSSHVVPTPQGGGAAVIGVALVVALAALAASHALPPGLMLHAVAIAAGALALMVVGLLDDIKGLPIALRLTIQAAAVAAIVLTLPADIRIVPGYLPLWLERALIFVGGLWFVNLYNFMDGIDLMTVSETVAVALGIALLAWLGLAPVWIGWVAVALGGALLGFAPLNMPPARLFLGDAGSLTIGLIVGALLMHVATSGALVAAVILPLYYLADATVTALRRLARGDKLWLGHRDHFYQAAMRNGYAVPQIVASIVMLNALLIALAVAAARYQGAAAWACGAIAAACVAILLRVFATARGPSHR